MRGVLVFRSKVGGDMESKACLDAVVQQEALHLPAMLSARYVEAAIDALTRI